MGGWPAATCSKILRLKLEVGGDDLKQIVEGVRDAACQLPNSFHLLRLVRVLLLSGGVR